MINRSSLIYTIIFLISITINMSLNVSLVNAQILSAKVSVVGMSCPFCAYGVEKKLKKVEGVESITINMQEGTATLSAKEAESINISQVPEAIKDSGFTPGKIAITAIGKLRTDKQERLLFQVIETKEYFFLKDLKYGIKKQILKYANEGDLVEVSGVINKQSNRTWTLSVEVIKDVVR